MSTFLKLAAPAFIAAALVSVVACSAPPRQPVAPVVADSPQTPVIIDNAMAGLVVVPNAHHNYDWTADGLLKYSFQLQNRTDHRFFVAYKTTFFDASGVTPVDQQPLRRQPMGPAETVTITVVSGSPAAKKVQVQVLEDR